MANSLETPPQITVESLMRIQKSLYGDDKGTSLLAQLSKTYDTAPEGGASSQGIQRGRKEHPFSRTLAKSFMLANEHHSSCIFAKTSATVGLGHLSTEERAARQRALEGDPLAAMLLQGSMGNQSEVDRKMDPLCETSWMETMTDVNQDYWHVGEGNFEIVRANPGALGRGPITGVHHIPSDEVYLYLEDDEYNRHYEIMGGEDHAAQRRFAVFGDLTSFRSRQAKEEFGGSLIPEGGRSFISEVITIRQPSALSRWYGYPDWLAAVASIELMKCLRQWKYDFFNNRGVPEFMLFILGQKMKPEEWKVVTDALNAGIGKGNSHKSLALNLENPALKIQLEKLAMEGQGEDNFDKTSASLAVSIVTAHRVPPLLAGIQIPGKLGATNELPNALVAFQTLVIGQAQKVFQQALGNTLGDPALNGGLGLTSDDFEFRKITDAYNMDSMDTMSRMRQTVPEAQAEGRDLSDGLKKVAPAAETAYLLAKERGLDSLADSLEKFIERAKAA